MMLAMNKKFHGWIDNIGFSLSMLCAIHCLFFPILLIVLPLFGMVFLLDATAERAFVVGSVLMAAISLFWGFRVHKKWQALLLYFVGATLLLFATFFMPHSHQHRSKVSQEEYTFSMNKLVGTRPQNNPFGLVMLESVPALPSVLTLWRDSFVWRSASQRPMPSLNCIASRR